MHLLHQDLTLYCLAYLFSLKLSCLFVFMDLLTQLLEPIQETISTSLQAIYLACSTSNNRYLAPAVIVFSLCFVFAFGSAMNSISCMISLSMLMPAYALEIRDLLLKMEGKGRILGSIVHFLEVMVDNSAWFVAILCLASFMLSTVYSGVPAPLLLVILGIYYFDMIYPHSKLPELPLDSFLCSMASFFIMYLFICSKTLKTHICSLAYAVLSSFGLFSLLGNIGVDGRIELFFNFENINGWIFHIMIVISMLLQCHMRSLLGVKRCPMEGVRNEVVDK